jgi:hypothetical protein
MPLIQVVMVLIVGGVVLWLIDRFFAKNCRTCVEMIEKYYASHIKTNLDAAAINIMRPKPKKKQNQLGSEPINF